MPYIVHSTFVMFPLKAHCKWTCILFSVLRIEKYEIWIKVETCFCKTHQFMACDGVYLFVCMYVKDYSTI